MDLAGKGVPSGDGVGFEIFDKGQFGLSDFVQRTNYLRAIQGELARTIAQLNGVVHARVMIVQPENKLLLTDQGSKTTASVFIELASPRIEPEAVNSIRHLVANSVEGLSIDDVAVVDQRGRVLSADLKEDPTLGNASSLIRYREQVEEYFSHKVESMLEPVVGAGNAIVRVSAEIDNEAATTTEEKYDPASAVIRTQTDTDDVMNTTEVRRGGAVGVTANTPDNPTPTTAEAAPTVTNSQNRKNHSLNYEINRSTSSIKRNPGSIKSLTAAVFVAARPAAAGATTSTPRTTAEIDGLRRVVLNALGLKGAAGQNLDELVSVQETPFQMPVIDKELEKDQAQAQIQNWVEVAVRYLAVVIALGAFYLFYRLLRKQRPEPVPVELLSATFSGNGRSPGTAAFTPEMLNELIRQKPANVGTALRDWVGTKNN
jgi:flagellar M-ring protein FliF